MDTETRAELVRRLRRFLADEDRSQAFVREIGDLLDERVTPGESMPADLYEELEVAAACYRPGGGDYMYDEDQLAAVFAGVLGRLGAT